MSVGTNIKYHPTQGIVRKFLTLMGGKRHSFHNARKFSYKSGAPANATVADNPNALYDVCVDMTNSHVYFCTVRTATGAAAGTNTNEIKSIPFVDSTGSGTFKLSYTDATTGVVTTTGAITYSATAATLVSRINTALDATFGTAAIVASGASLAAIILTFSGTGFTNRPVGLFTATVIAASTGYTINGSGTVGTPSTCAVTTAGVTANTTGTVWTQII